MNICELFIRRPVAASLLTLGIALFGIQAFLALPLAPLPQVDFPAIFVQAQMPGANPETMAATVAAPLERHLGQIADVHEMTSQSTEGATFVVMLFGLDRDINGAARDVESAINAARADLPTALRSNPTYHMVNTADAPVMILALTSPLATQGQLYDSASSVLEQKLSQVEGVGQVTLGGSSLPAVRVELDPGALFKYGSGLEDVRAAIAGANANSPKGVLDQGNNRYQLYSNDQADRAAQYRGLVIAYRNGAAVRLSDVAEIDDSVEDIRNEGVFNGAPAIPIQVLKTPGANVIATIDRVKALLPELQAALPADMRLTAVYDATPAIRNAVTDTELSLIVSALMVLLVVYLFLDDAWATTIPGVAIPVCILGTFVGMKLFGYSLDNLSLMALTISTGFVVDDAIVIVENVRRHLEAGMSRRQAALTGASEVSFTVLSMSLSLTAVFIPVLLMGGLVGRIFREFAVTLVLAILLSLLVSVAATPVMCSRLLRAPGRSAEFERNGLQRLTRGAFGALQRFYSASLPVALRHPSVTLVVLFAVFGLNIYLYAVIPKGFFPQQDSGLLTGGIVADQSTSFQALEQKLRRFVSIVTADPAVANVVGQTGGRATNTGSVFVVLKPKTERDVTSDQVIDRLRPKLAEVAGATLFLQSSQDVRAGGRQSNAQYQYTLEADDTALLEQWMPRLVTALAKEPALVDVATDQQQKGLGIALAIDRATASRLGISPRQIDETLYDALGQRQVSTIYTAVNQYHVVLEVAPRFRQNPAWLDQIYVSAAAGTPSGTQSSNAVAGTVDSGGSRPAAAKIAGDAARNVAINSIISTGSAGVSSGAAVSTGAETMIPLHAISQLRPSETPVAVNHQGQSVAETISFNLTAGKSLSDAVAAIDRASRAIGLPSDVRGEFAGAAALFESGLSDEPLLILAALLTIYIVLGVLYESFIHPFTILSTLPSAGLGALLALLFFGIDFNFMALVGIVLLIGIVKKNAIMMVDFALDAERRAGRSPEEAIFEACMLRLRPIVMTTLAAILGAAPLAIGLGEGGELRRPLGVSIIGGLVVSLVLTLYTTPVVYLWLDRVRQWRRRTRVHAV